jgi:hypothetical protein
MFKATLVCQAPVMPILVALILTTHFILTGQKEHIQLLVNAYAIPPLAKSLFCSRAGIYYSLNRPNFGFSHNARDDASYFPFAEFLVSGSLQLAAVTVTMDAQETEAIVPPLG